MPRLVTMPGAMTPGGSASRSVSLRNPSRAPAYFHIVPTATAAGKGKPSPLRVTPAKGVVPPLSDLEVSVTFSASGLGDGQQEHSLICKVCWKGKVWVRSGKQQNDVSGVLSK